MNILGWLRPTPEHGLAETLAITIKCARRCAYDLSHAADCVDDARLARVYRTRAKHWQSLFSSGTSMKDYRLELHREIEKRDAVIESLRAELKATGLSGYAADEVPF